MKENFLAVFDGTEECKSAVRYAARRAKINNPKARKAFAARHKCSQKKDRTKASYWSCRLPRYAKQLGLSVKNPGGFW